MNDIIYQSKEIVYHGDKYVITYFVSNILGAPVIVNILCKERGVLMDPERNKNLVDAAMIEVER